MYFYIVFLGALALIPATSLADCNCGYYDPVNRNLFTEYLIVYFNETESFPDDAFTIKSYEDGYEKSWNARYRNGANSSNVKLTSSPPSYLYPSNTSLELGLSPSSKLHLVNGAEIQSIRRDIQYGSFRSLIQPSQPFSGGSAVSFGLDYNLTQSIQVNTMNTDKPDTAWISTLLGEEFPDRDLGVNYTVILNNTNTKFKGVSPWDFTEFRFDWMPDKVDFWIGDVLTRSAKSDKISREKYPVTPSPIYFKHWSDGDPYAMEGPPPNRTLGRVGWTRAFFNTSSMNETGHEQFDARCDISQACPMDDFTIRGHSEWAADATQAWKALAQYNGLHWFAVWAISASVALTLVCAMNIIYQRWPTKQSKIRPPAKENFCRRLPPQLSFSSRSCTTAYSSGATTLMPSTPVNLTRPHSLKEPTHEIIEEGGPSKSGSVFEEIESEHSSGGQHAMKLYPEKQEEGFLGMSQVSEKKGPGESHFRPVTGNDSEETTKTVPVVPSTPSAAPKKRINYLAGLISFSTIIVTLIHFTFTFVPAAGMPGEPHHYRSEIWVNKIIAPFLLNQAFVGVFFITSCRFLIEKYLKTGDLLQIAEKTTGRTFRVVIPIAAIAMLEYFLIDCGAIKWLEYLPSVTWSTWPYAVGYTDFSHYLSEILELIYLIPNAAPQITYNYCTGVLWTIPVQLQFTWTTLLGCIVIYEITTPWKRGCYYTFCIINHWYAQSWGTFFWFGILLTDLDITYQYRPWLRDRKWILYPILWISTIACFGGLANDLITAFTGFALPSVERGIHPDIYSGLPIAQTSNAGYPDYFFPRLNGLIFSVGLQVLVELSPITQAIFSIKPFLIIFPHIFTIYLIHGMIFWSLGSVIAVHLSAAGWPFWAVVLVVGLVCYTVLFLCLPLLTPVVETLGLNVTRNIWKLAREGIMKRERTLWPFRGDLFFDESRGVNGDEENPLEENAARIAVKEGVDEGSVEKKLRKAEEIAVKEEKYDS